MTPSSRLCLIVEDQTANRDWLSEALRLAFGDVEAVAVGTLREARQWLDGDPRAGGLWLALIDLGLPDGCGVDLIRGMKAAFPGTLLVVASIYDDDRHLFEALSAGADGYLLKGQEAETMAHYLKRLDSGEPALSPSIARRLLGHFQKPEPPDAGDEARLTGRETETLVLLAKGLTINEAAKALALKPQTVAGYVKVIYQKLNVSTRAEATLKAVRRGLA